MVGRLSAALGVLLPSLLASTASLAQATNPPEPSWDVVERHYRELPPEARRLTGPLFWLHGDESKERLEQYVAKVAEGGNGTFTAESRPHNDWLGPNWYRDLDICLQAAKKHDLTMWIFDEKWWPSQELGGKVPIEYGSKVLGAAATVVAGPGAVQLEGLAGPQFIGAVAGRAAAARAADKGALDGASLVDLKPFIKDGKLAWQAPAGDWKVVVFTWSHYKGKRRTLVDGASPDCADWFIKTVYQPHYDRFKDDFGKAIPGFFYDEPETHGDWGTDVMNVLAERGIDWKKALVGYKLGLAGDEGPAARYQYLDAYAEAWGRTMYGGITKWCREHNVVSIGHFLEHHWEYLDPRKCAGNMVQLMKYSDMGAIDAVFKQFKPGVRDMGLWQTPKLGSSISHVYGKKDDLAMVEIFGARGQDLSYPEMKWWTDLMHVAGINFHIPHSFNPRAPYDTDCPPYFYNGGYEPRWPLYRVYADYTTRLSVMLSGGRHVCPVALLYLGNSYHVGKAVPPEEMSTALQDALYDCDWLPYDVFASARIDRKEIAVHRERYKVLVVPPVEVIPVEALEKVKQFFDAGGVVVAYGMLPSKPATLGKTSADVARLVADVWGGSPGAKLTATKTSPAGGRSYFLSAKPSPEDLKKVLGDAAVRPTLEVAEGDTENWLHVLHRVKAGRDVFFVTNQKHTGEPKKFRLRVSPVAGPAGHVECWDPMRNEMTRPACLRADDNLFEVDLTLYPSESALLVFTPAGGDVPQRPNLPARLDAGVKPLREPIPVVRTPAPPVADPVPPSLAEMKSPFEGGQWVWYPEAGGNPRLAAPPGTRYLRATFDVPAGRAVASAKIAFAVDNEAEVVLNGQAVGGSTSWAHVEEADLAKALKPGRNVLAVTVTNGSDQPNPAGFIARYTVAFADGGKLEGRSDATWKAAEKPAEGWQKPDFDDSKWPAAMVVGKFGDKPWGAGRGGRGPTLPPPQIKSDPFAGTLDLPADVDLNRARVVLEMDAPAPEAAARITVNGTYAGGFVEGPFRLDVTRFVKPGKNAIEIAPFAPKAVKGVVYPKE